MNFGAFTIIEREVLITFKDGTTTSLKTKLGFDEIKKLMHKPVKTIKNRE